MEGIQASEMREKLIHWIQEGLRLFPHLAGLLQNDDGARAQELEREVDKLRRELTDNRKELDDLRKEQDRLRADRDEVGQALARLMDSVQPISQIAQRFGPRRSPFEREQRAGADPRAPSPAPAPAPKPG